MTTADIINGILDREKEQKPPYLAKGDLGGRTNWGISERAHPEVWMSGPPTRERAYQVYLNEYVKPWEFVAYEPLKVQLIDCTVLHGLDRAVRLLQETLGIAIDGKAGPATRIALTKACDRVERHDEGEQRVPGPQHRRGDPERHLFGALERDRLRNHRIGAEPRHVNNALVAYRLKFIDGFTDLVKSQKINEEGWENRALLFLV